MGLAQTPLTLLALRFRCRTNSRAAKQESEDTGKLAKRHSEEISEVALDEPLQHWRPRSDTNTIRTQNYLLRSLMQHCRWHCLGANLGSCAQSCTVWQRHSHGLSPKIQVTSAGCVQL